MWEDTAESVVPMSSTAANSKVEAFETEVDETMLWQAGTSRPKRPACSAVSLRWASSKATVTNLLEESGLSSVD